MLYQNVANTPTTSASFTTFSLIFCIIMNLVPILTIAFMMKKPIKNLSFGSALAAGISMDFFFTFICGVLTFFRNTGTADQLSIFIIWGFVWDGIMSGVISAKFKGSKKKTLLLGLVLLVTGILAINYLTLCIMIIIVKFYYMSSTYGYIAAFVTAGIAVFCAFLAIRWMISGAEEAEEKA